MQLTLTQANDLVDRCDRLFHRAAKAYERGTKERTILDMARTMKQVNAIRKRAEAILEPLGVVVSYPGPYPSFEVNSETYYTTEAAVSAALEKKQ